MWDPLTGLLDFLWNLFWIPILILITAVYGVVVRMRVNYTPSTLVMSGAVPNATTGFVEMWKRVLQIEGLGGFFKGGWPIWLGAIALNFVGTILVKFIPFWVFEIVIALLDIPVLITITRSIVIAENLSIFNPLRAIPALFTSMERRNPLALFLTPGVAVSESIRLVFIFFVLLPIRYQLLTYGTYTFTLIWIAASLLCTPIIAPLEVISARLTVQRNYGGVELGGITGSAEEHNAGGAGGEGEVVCLRQDTDRGPYEGFVDCVQSVVKEEGVGALFRGWYYTAGFLMLGRIMLR